MRIFVFEDFYAIEVHVLKISLVGIIECRTNIWNLFAKHRCKFSESYLNVTIYINTSTHDTHTHTYICIARYMHGVTRLTIN